MRLSRRWSAPFFVAALLAPVVFASDPSPDEAKGAKPNGPVLTEKANNTKVDLKRGELLTLRLEATAGTGYTWQVVKVAEKVLAARGKPEFVRPDKDRKVVGGKGAQVIRFEAVSAGTTDLELHYRRPFEKDKRPAKTFKVMVTVE